MSLTRETVDLSPRELAKEKVPVPEWAPKDMPAEQAYVWVRTLEGDERDAWEKTLTVGKGRKATVSLDSIRAKLAVATCVDDDGKPIFTEADIAKLNKLTCLPLSRVFDTASKLNGLSKEDVDELVGESKSDQN